MTVNRPLVRIARFSAEWMAIRYWDETLGSYESSVLAVTVLVWV
jgi:hypothetical protein